MRTAPNTAPTPTTAPSAKGTTKNTHLLDTQPSTNQRKKHNYIDNDNDNNHAAATATTPPPLTTHHENDEARTAQSITLMHEEDTTMENTSIDELKETTNSHFTQHSSPYTTRTHSLPYPQHPFKSKSLTQPPQRIETTMTNKTTNKHMHRRQQSPKLVDAQRGCERRNAAQTKEQQRSKEASPSQNAKATHQ